MSSHRDHNSSTARTYEAQNDLHLEELNSKVSALHKLTLDIHHEVNDQVNLLEETDSSFTTFTGSLNTTVSRFRHMISVRNQRYLCYIVICIVSVFLLFYYYGLLNHNKVGDPKEDNG
ncbi:hypothetical protein G9A89_012985 [Geosiphon pyriformis]|nr:hypothetical protein G9A89_012985 [Geosiphon pyriformis]